MRTQAVVAEIERAMNQLKYVLYNDNVTSAKIILKDLVKKIEKEGIKNPPKVLNRQIRKSSQRGILLEFMQQNPYRKIMDIDFTNYPKTLPFIGAKPGARLSELKSMGLIDVVERKEAKMSFEKKCRPSNVYQINQNGLDYILKD